MEWELVEKITRTKLIDLDSTVLPPREDVFAIRSFLEDSDSFSPAENMGLRNNWLDERDIVAGRLGRAVVEPVLLHESEGLPHVAAMPSGVEEAKVIS
jgi:hypothetical protein